MVNVLVIMILKKIKIHYSLILFMILSLFTGFIKELLFILFILFLHEIGHMIMILFFGGKIKSLNLTLVGGLMDIDYTGSIFSNLLVHSSWCNCQYNSLIFLFKT